MSPLPAPRPRVALPGISGVSWEHPADRAALQALRAVPGFDEAVRKIIAFIGGERGVRLLERILDDEIRHVRIGANHFSALCSRRGEVVEILWNALVRRHFRGSVKPPFNDSARAAAGLSPIPYRALA